MTEANTPPKCPTCRAFLWRAATRPYVFCPTFGCSRLYQDEAIYRRIVVDPKRILRLEQTDKLPLAIRSSDDQQKTTQHKTIYWIYGCAHVCVDRRKVIEPDATPSNGTLIAKTVDTRGAIRVREFKLVMIQATKSAKEKEETDERC